MSDELADLFMKALNIPDPNPYLFEVGQLVKLKKGLSKDGQTHFVWNGARVRIVRRYSSMLSKDHWYTCHIEGRPELFDDFREEEITHIRLKQS